jgi:hypothetical protein
MYSHLEESNLFLQYLFVFQQSLKKLVTVLSQKVPVYLLGKVHVPRNVHVLRKIAYT